MGSHVRNTGPIPLLESEGIFTKEIPAEIWASRWEREWSDTPARMQQIEDKAGKRSDGAMLKKISNSQGNAFDTKHDPDWTCGLPTWQRLFLHHTQSSLRHCAIYRCPNAPKDQLDIVLDSTYEHQLELFPDKTDVYLQKETQGINTWRLLRNYRLVQPKRSLSRGHPLTYGGTTSRSNIYSAKLGIPAPHVAQTNAGYSRREDGALYKV